MSNDSPSANILIDRLLNASDSSDAISSLKSLSKRLSSHPSDCEVLSSSSECLHALFTLISQSKLPSNIECEDAQVISIELLTELMNHSSSPTLVCKQVLCSPISDLQPPLLHSLIDCLCTSDEDTSTYARILALRLLEKTFNLAPTKTQETILSAPDGFHRLISLLNSDETTEESIRNEAIILLGALAQNSSVMRKLLLFSEGYERILAIAISGTVEKAVILDCISTCKNLLVEDGSNGSCEMFLNSPEQRVLGGCIALLDLRYSKAMNNPKIGIPTYDETDDLDDLLSSSKDKKSESYLVPVMTNDEEDICNAVLDLFQFAIEIGNQNPTSNVVKSKLLQFIPFMGAFVSLSLYSPSQETSLPYLASAPTLSVQCHALDLLGEIFEGQKDVHIQSVSPLWEYYKGDAVLSPLDRLLRLSSSCLYPKSEKPVKQIISSHARCTLRKTLRSEDACQLILHGLAPPPPDEGSLNSQVPIVKEIVEHLLVSTDIQSQEAIFLTLETLLTQGQDTAKEIMIKFPLENGKGVLLEYMLTSLDVSKFDDNTVILDQDLLLSLLCTWSFAAPPSTMNSIFQLPQTLLIPTIFIEKNNSYAGILLGLWLHHLSELEDREADIYGWSTKSILNLIQSYGLSKYTTLLDKFLLQINDEAYRREESSSSERSQWQSQFRSMVSCIRGSLVSSTTNSAEPSDKEAELYKLLQQSQSELSRVSESYQSSQDLIKKQSTEIKNLKLKFQPATSVDEALVEQVDKNAKADLYIEELEKKLESKTNHLGSLEKEFSNMKQDIENSKIEKHTLEEELVGLSSAYSQLEQEYSKVIATNASSNNENSSEIQRLQAQIKASDEWMTMAVDRMNSMAAENAMLQQKGEIQNSTKHPESDGVTDTNTSSIKISSLEAEVSTLNEELNALKAKDQDQINYLQNQVSNLSQQLERTSPPEKNEALEEEIEKLKKVINEKNNLIEESKRNEILSQTVQQNDNIVLEHQQEMEDQLNTLTSKHKAELKEKDDLILSIQAELESFKSTNPSKISSVSHGESKDTALSASDFFSSSSSPLAGPTKSTENEEEVVKLRTELSQLQTAYDEAQEWMTNAYAAQEKMAADAKHLTEENQSLKNDLSSIKGNFVDVGDQDKLNQLEIERDIAVAEVENLRKMINSDDLSISYAPVVDGQPNMHESKSIETTPKVVEKLTMEVSELKTMLQKSNGDLQLAKEESGHLKSKLQILEQKNKQSEQKISDMETTHAEEVEEWGSKYESSNAMASEQLEVANLSSLNLQKEVEDLKEERLSLLNEQEQYQEAINELKKSIVGYQDWTKTAQERISDIECERDSLEENCEVLKLSEANLKKEIANLKNKTEFDNDEKNTTENSFEQKYEDAIKNEKIIRNKLEDFEGEINTLHSQLEEKEEVEKRLNNALQEVAELEKRVGDLENSRDTLQLKCDTFSQATENQNEKIDDLQAEVDLLNSQLEDAQRDQESLVETENEVLRLKDQLQEGQIQFTTLENRCKDFELENLTFLKERDSMKNDFIDVLGLSDHSASIDDVKGLLKTKIQKDSEMLKDLQNQMVDMKAQSDNAIELWKERVEVLEVSLSEKQVELQNSNASAQNAIDQWEEKCKSLEEMCQESDDLVSIRHELEEYQQKCNQFEEAFVLLQEQIAQKDEDLASAEDEAAGYFKQLSDDREKTQDALAQWQETTDELECSVEVLQAALDERDQVIQNIRSEADVAISHWEARCASLEEQIDEQDKQLDEADDRINTLQEEVEGLKSSNKLLSTMLENAKSKINTLTADVEYMNAKSDEERKALIAEIEAKVEQSMSLEMELDGAQSSRDEIIQKIKEYRERLTLEQQARAITEESLRVKEEALHSEIQKKLHFENELSEARKQKALVDEALRIKARETQKNTEKWSKECGDLKAKLSETENKLTNTQVEKGQLYGELKEATEALSAQKTDEASIKAMSMAADVLRSQLSDLRLQLASDRERIVEEQKLRVLAENEMERLKMDLALLVKSGKTFGDEQNIAGEIRKLASRAADDMFRDERREMKDLRFTLEKVMNELQVAKAAQLAAEEKLSTAHLQTCMRDKEISSSRTEINRLTLTIEKMQTNEQMNHASFQCRIDELEENRDSMISYHAGEIEALKAEISQLGMEKDRILHNLHESERSNEILTSSGDINNKMEIRESMDVQKLRLINLKLLASASEAASKTERRIRAAVAANAASSDAELIFERELTAASEKTCGELRSKLDKLHKEGLSNIPDRPLSKKVVLSGFDSVATDEILKLKTSLENLKTDSKSLEEENKQLKSKLEESKVEISELENKYRQLESKARESERDVHFESTVATEVARLRVESSANKQIGGQLIVRLNGDSITGSDIGQQMTAEEMCDLVYQLENAAKEERTHYQNLLEDHEECLAELAQQDVEITSLRSLLEKLGGEKALQEVDHEIEESVSKRISSSS